MHVVVIGCGIVGAAIAYELSQIKGLQVTVIDQKPPAQASTGAALGVLMGIISHKLKGKAWRMRQASIAAYEEWIPKLEAVSGRKIPFNRQGILSLCLAGDDLTGWENLAATRLAQGWQLEVWDKSQLQQACPQVNIEKFVGAVYSPQDRQLDPITLTLALVDAAIFNGVSFKFGIEVLGISSVHSVSADSQGEKIEIETDNGKITADKTIIAAGLGSTPLTEQLQQKVDIRPVLGQAIHFHVGHALGNPDFQPVLTSNDVHIVPCGAGIVPITDYWVGATVEFPNEIGNPLPPDAELLETVKQQAISYCPQLAHATITRTWLGLRPRPENRPAPIIEKLPGFSNILLATGHYRNGVLLAPATAIAIREMIVSN
ncbi:FAD-dependent oxidoreductase [Calothrix sp. UHCC 0171]|uniref:NAD(P)/FAD-dependent oxidoreductase n=1 Tax=Calothrix sp. UHCC 0171 TaxID=3110245 RepID=UPI002B206FD1|nr:FAD-dependent oxidoreductase [Calothrix sp. UHCC 0171]MEA5573779.1 FAD-dependent oxidoreductase [Calothrix sp. UHCC 0171]